MVLSVISGVLLMRRVVGARALDERDADHLVELLEAVFGAVVDTRSDGTARIVTVNPLRAQRGRRSASRPLG